MHAATVSTRQLGRKLWRCGIKRPAGTYRQIKNPHPITPERQRTINAAAEYHAPVQQSGACMCDCIHVDDLSAILAEKGLDKRPAGK